MEQRSKYLASLHAYTNNIDSEITMILQSLQWDREQILLNKNMTICKHDAGHRIPSEFIEKHENQCYLRLQGYPDKDIMLPDPPYTSSVGVVKLDKLKILEIIENASSMDPSFRKGMGCEGTEPLTIDRLYSSYTSDERRAIYDAVVSTAPSCHDLSDLALPSTNEEPRRVKTREEVLAELRNMKRRRTKYRVAARTTNYSDVLRDVISTQMEIYSNINLNTSNTAIDSQFGTSEKNMDKDSVKKSRNLSKHLNNEGETTNYKNKYKDSEYIQYECDRRQDSVRREDERSYSERKYRAYDDSSSYSSKTSTSKKKYSSHKEYSSISKDNKRFEERESRKHSNYNNRDSKRYNSKDHKRTYGSSHYEQNEYDNSNKHRRHGQYSDARKHRDYESEKKRSRK